MTSSEERYTSASEYVNAAPTPSERVERKRRVFHILYGAGPDLIRRLKEKP